MCSVGNLIGGLIGGAAAYFTGGASLLAGAAAGASIGGMLTAPKIATPQMPGPAPNPVADQTAANDSARVVATQRKRAIAGGSPRSLLATAGGAMGDTSAAQIGTATAVPVTKSTLGG